MGSKIGRLLAVAALSSGLASAAEPEPTVFARVDDTIIPAEQFNAAVRDGARKRFYHGQIPEADMARFQREIGEQLVERVLLLKEARRRRIEADPEWVRPRLQVFERRFSQHPEWQEHGERLLQAAEQQLSAESQIRNLEALVRAEAGTPSADTLRAFYRENPEKFTEPERFRVSTILLKVDPSSPSSVWQAAMTEARDIVAKVRAGTDFGELARTHSGDPSAAQGGDMGYVHRGMLGEAAQAVVDAAPIGEVTEPVRLLEGIAIFRVEDRPAAKLRAFEDVAERARDLWLRERREALWNGLLDKLKAQADIQINEQHYLPLPG